MAAPLPLGLCINMVRPEAVVAVSKAAEDMGYANVWMGEHFVLPKEDWWVDYPQVNAARKRGEPVSQESCHFGPRDHFYDANTYLAAVAGATSKIRLGYGIFLVGLHDPIMAARQFGTLDRLSGGRLDMTVGLGWSSHEYALLGVDWKTRAQRYDEHIAAIRVLTSERWPEFHGEHVNFGPVGMEPKPLQRPFPIRMGASTKLGAKRAALNGDGFFGEPELFEEVRRIRAEAGLTNPYDFTALRIYANPTRTELDELAGIGADLVAVSPFPNGLVGEAEGIRLIEEFARDAGLI